jgi:hypothetical protein
VTAYRDFAQAKKGQKSYKVTKGNLFLGGWIGFS